MIQQRSLAKQFEQMDLGSKKGFVVNTLTTANQRATSSKSGGAIANSNISSFAQKLVSQQPSKGGTGAQTPLGPQTQESTMVKINNLTSDVNDILIGSRSGSIGTSNSHGANKNIISQHKMPSTQRETASGTGSVVEPKVMSCNYKKQQPATRFDHQQIQALMTNLKQTSTGSGVTAATSSSGSGPAKHQYARSTSRGKDGVPTSLAQVNKLTALLGKPISMAGRNSQVNASASSGAVGSSQNSLSTNMFHPRPQNLRVKAKQAGNEIA